MMSRIVVREHAGRSGKSVYRWRVYREWDASPGVRKGRTQLWKGKHKEDAEGAAEFYRRNDEKLKARYAEGRA